MNHQAMDVVILGENDVDETGYCHGAVQAEKVAAELAQLRYAHFHEGRTFWALPPDRAKDVREWANWSGQVVDAELGKRWLREIRGRLQDASDSEAVDFEALDSATFVEKKFPREWLINQVLVANQPAIVGGPKKSLKSTLTVSLAVAIASGDRWLGKFEVPTTLNVAILNGESGEATLQETFKRICRSMGIKSPGSLSIHWGFSATLAPPTGPPPLPASVAGPPTRLPIHAGSGSWS